MNLPQFEHFPNEGDTAMNYRENIYFRSFPTVKPGATNFANCGNERIDVKSGCSSLVSCGCKIWIQHRKAVKMNILTWQNVDNGALQIVLYTILRAGGSA